MTNNSNHLLQTEMESEGYFKSIFDNSLYGIGTTIGTDFRFVRVNDALCSLLEYERDELVGVRTVADVTLPDDYYPQNEQLLTRLVNNEIQQFQIEKQYVTKSGKVIDVIVYVLGFYDNDGKYIGSTGSVLDITERKRMERELKRSEEKYRSLVDNSMVGVFTSALDGRFLFVNNAMARLADFDTPELMMTKSAISLWKDPQQRDQMLGIMCEHGSVSNYEAEIITNTNRHIHVLFSAELLGDTLSGMVMDITESKKLKKQLKEESAYLLEEVTLEYNYKNIVGTSDAIKYVLFKVEQVSESDSNVLILGETGTGKELVARAIHHNSARKKRTLIKVNCATLPPHLIESELFGHERGSFTSAHTRHLGRFEVADGSSLFLDEIGELPLELQAKLLRVIEDGEFERLGSNKTIKVDVRIIAATNRDLEKDVSEGRFREDLWYRINVFPITVPPLRERVEDIPLIAQYYLDQFNKRQGKKVSSIPVKTMKTMQNYGWPGNVRELANIIERAVINTSGSKLRLAEELKQGQQRFPEEFKSLHDMERDYILKVLEKTHWKVSGKNSAAEILGLNRGTLRAKMKKMDIQKP